MPQIFMKQNLKHRPCQFNTSPSFTLLELLIVIATLAILGAITFIVINPAENMRAARDIERMIELNTIDEVISLYTIEYSGTSLGTSTYVYISLPDSNPTCGSYTLPALPPGYTYACTLTATLQKTNGTGWIPVNLASLSTGSPIQKLPIDPKNTVGTAGNYYYSYITGGSYHIAATLEATKYKLGGEQDKVSRDGGKNTAQYEVGTDKTLLPVDSGDTSLVGWWTFDETSWNNNCSTSTVYDHSGNNNHGKSCPNGAGTTTPVTGKKGNAINLNGTSQYVDTGNTINAKMGQTVTMMTWIQPLALSSSSRYGIMGTQYWTDNNFSIHIHDTPNKYFINWGSNKCKNFSTPVPSIGQWDHVVVVYDANLPSDNFQLYINGQLIVAGTTYCGGSSSYSNPLAQNTSQTFKIGTLVGYFNGYIDDVRVYNRALSTQEIQAIYNATK